MQTSKYTKFIDEIINEIEDELEEATATGNVAGYQTPNAFGNNSEKSKSKTKEVSTQSGYTVVGDNIRNINEVKFELPKLRSIRLDLYMRAFDCKPNSPKQNKIRKQIKDVENTIEFEEGRFKQESISESDSKTIKLGKNTYNVTVKGSRIHLVNVKMSGDKFIFNNKKELQAFLADYSEPIGGKQSSHFGTESVSESKKIREQAPTKHKVKRTNRWLELKNDESMHPNKKLSVGLKELKYQLKEIETFFRWHNKLKNINELESDTYWKRTNTHIGTIKERLVNIIRTIQEIEK